MLSRKLIAGAAAVLVGGLATLLYSTRRPPHPVFIDPADRALVVQGKAIYANNCVACHGEALQGQPNWRERLPNGRLPAPPHDKTGHTWHHPDAMLFNMVKNGLVPGKTAPPGYESDMPAYGEILTDEEIVAVLAYIKSDWPSKVLQAQKEVTLQQRN
ncbi:c-type cytochrome [Pollutimonas sp. H1-120]|uniref:c-type cytochrome n=1 Tax=Pollutimonas sp. H1-120 TaxID=3148824 RepID=UPI003B52A1F3